MSDRVVCDASAVAAVLLEDAADAWWAADALAGVELHAPHLMPFEVANVFRRRELAGQVSSDLAALAHADLLVLPVELWSHEVLARRAWALRANLTAYDASYVALAELTGAKLVTLDRRLAAAPGVRCEVLMPPVP